MRPNHWRRVAAGLIHAVMLLAVRAITTASDPGAAEMASPFLRVFTVVLADGPTVFLANDKMVSFAVCKRAAKRAHVVLFNPEYRADLTAVIHESSRADVNPRLVEANAEPRPKSHSPGAYSRGNPTLVRIVTVGGLKTRARPVLVECHGLDPEKPVLYWLLGRKASTQSQ